MEAQESFTFYVQRPGGGLEALTLPLPLPGTYSLMEILKGEGYPILATCGGMALCASCEVRQLKAPTHGPLPPPEDAELAMLESLPNYAGDTRLSCQLRATEALHGLVVQVVAEE